MCESGREAAIRWRIGRVHGFLPCDELPIPDIMFGEVSAVVRLDYDDPDAIGCYELTDDQANRIANIAHRKNLPPRAGFLP
jgi:hypothetical protein